MINAKKKTSVKLLDYSERGALEISGSDPLTVTSVIDAVHLILRGYMRGGVAEVIPLVRDLPYGEKSLIHTIQGLAKLASLRPRYDEGEICIKFLRDWGILTYTGKEYQDEKLDSYLITEDEDDDR